MKLKSETRYHLEATKAEIEIIHQAMTIASQGEVSHLWQGLEQGNTICRLICIDDIKKFGDDIMAIRKELGLT